MPFLGLLGGAIPWRLVALIAGALAAVAVFLFVVGTIKENGKLKVDLTQAVETSNANAAAAEAQRLETARIQDVADGAAKTKIIIRRVADVKRKEIVDAPPSDDGPLAPVLRRALDGLQRREDAPQAPTTPAAANTGRPPIALRGTKPPGP